VRPGGVLFLDLSKHIGWVYGHPADNAVPLWGGIGAPAEGSYGHVFNALMNALDDLLERHKPARVGIEDMITQRHNSTRTARLTPGIHAIADVVCYLHEIEPERVGVDRIRSAVIGRCRLTPLEKAVRPKLTVKTAIVEPWIAAHGWGEITSNDARDAAVGFAYLTGVRARGKR
jgi:hypothetical protein